MLVVHRIRRLELQIEMENNEIEILFSFLIWLQGVGKSLCCAALSVRILWKYLGVDTFVSN
jgi:hypothetical protein